MESRSEATTPSSATAATSAGASVERMQTSGPSGGGGDCRADFVEPADEPLDEAAHVSLDRRHPGLRDQPDPGDAGVDVRHRRRACVEATAAPVRPVARDLHVEDVLVREPARLHRDQLLDEPWAERHERQPGRGEQVLDGAADDDVSCLRRRRPESPRSPGSRRPASARRARARDRRSPRRRARRPSGRRRASRRRARSARRSRPRTPRDTARPGRPRRRAAPAHARSARSSGTRSRR